MIFSDNCHKWQGGLVTTDGELRKPNKLGEIMIKGLYLKFSLALVITFGFLALPLYAAEPLKKVDNEKVCMVTDMHFGKKQIPVAFEGKTYFGCCENCKETLSKNAKARTAIDPVSGKSVDKATAYIVTREDNSVLYFENEKTFKQYGSRASNKSKVDSSQHQHHSNH